MHAIANAKRSNSPTNHTNCESIDIQMNKLVARKMKLVSEKENKVKEKIQ